MSVLFVLSRIQSPSLLPLLQHHTNNLYTDANLLQVQNGTTKATLEESVTAEYRVSEDYCGLEMLPDTFNPQHCK